MRGRALNREEFKQILDVYILGMKAFNQAYHLFIGQGMPQVDNNDEGLYAKIVRLELLIKNNSVYADKHSDEDVDEFFDIIHSEQMMLDEKVDKLFAR